MCPFCIGTAMWLAGSAVSAGGISTLAIAKFWNKNARQREQGGSHEQQSAEQ